MQKNLPYFLVIAALIFLIVAVLSSGKESPQPTAPTQSIVESEEVVRQEEAPFSLAVKSTRNDVEAAQEQDVNPLPEKVFNIYTDRKAPDNHFAPSGWMGDYGDLNLNDQYMADSYSGTTCIQITYSAKKTQGAGWAGIFWQNPPNNWGEKKGGFDLTGYNKLTFWARGEDGGEAIEKFKVGGIKGAYLDSLEVEMGPVVLTKEWKKYTINLVGEDLSYVSGGFCWVTASRLAPEGATFYLDDIRYEYDPGLKAEMTKGAEMPFDVYTERTSAANHYCPSGWMGDYGDLKIEEGWSADPHSGTTCIKIDYSAKKTQGAGWAGIFWQNPPNNWGEIKGGFDLSGANKVTFWARGEDGGEAIEKFKVGGIKGAYPDSAEVEVGPIVLTKEWKQYSINLMGQDLSYVSGGFCWVTSSRLAPEGATFYLDDIRYEYDPGLKAKTKTAEDMPFDVYTDKTSIGNHFIASGWMGDYGDLKIEEGWTVNPYLGNTCIRIEYSGRSSQGARWAGIYWQNPSNNWGQAKDAGYDLSRSTKLTFWARGEEGGERIEEFKVGGISGDYPDSDVAGIGPVVLTPEWKQYTIDLAGKDFSYVIGGFCWATNVDVNPGGCVFYLDDIRYK